MTVRDILKSAAGLGTTVAPFTLYAWGDNQYGQIGNGQANYTGDVATFLQPRSSPAQVIGLYSSKIAANKSNSFAIRTNGTMWGWGSTINGSMAYFSGDKGKSYPYQIGTDTDWTDVQTSGGTTLAIKSNGTLWGWGGRPTFGDGTSSITYSVVQIGTSTWKDISIIVMSGYGIKTDGTLWAWGYNGDGRLGLGDSVDRSVATQVGMENNWNYIVAQGVTDSNSLPVATVTAIKTDGTLWAWGYNKYGQLGQNDIVHRSSPVQVGTLAGWASVSTACNTTAAIRSDGTLWACGYNGDGQLGIGDRIDRSSPVQVGTLTNWSKVCLLNNYFINGGSLAPSVIAIKTDGTLWAWGANTDGQLGTGDRIFRSSPVQVGTLTGWTSLPKVSGRHALASRGSSLYSWGYNGTPTDQGSGQLGYPTDGTSPVAITSFRSSPIQIGATNQWINFAYGETHSAAVRANGSLWAWGNNVSGQLGTGNRISRSSPVQVGTSTNWNMVSTGFDFTLALTKNGTLWAWGSNASGRLGTNDLIARSSPVQVGALSNWAYVNAGYDYSLAVKTDGTLWAWGYNIGVPPVQVGVLTNWLKAIGGHNTSAAIKTDGTLWTWGVNENGELGLGNVVNRVSPVQVGSMNNWKDVSIGYETSGSDHMIAVKTDGTIWAWGSNGSGQLGVNNRTDYSSPVQIGSSTDWSGVVAGQYHSMAVKTDGTLWAWGANKDGQLGLNNLIARSSPVQVGTLTNWIVNSAGITSAGGIF